MGPEITMIPSEQRDSYGQYRILPGHTNVFEFTVPMFGSVEIKVAHILPNSQDFSIVLWISETPLDGLLLEEGFGNHKANRRADQFVIYDSFLRANEDDTRLFLDSYKTYFLNVKNLQNRFNSYELDFSITPPINP